MMFNRFMYPHCVVSSTIISFHSLLSIASKPNHTSYVLSIYFLNGIHLVPCPEVRQNHKRKTKKLNIVFKVLYKINITENTRSFLQA